ncbi:MAG: FtsX-like permease family protein [Ignavibacteriae bacterium]|nr:MAG: FtsX-like permease family protein [Ignavibacteriota bacterium]
MGYEQLIARRYLLSKKNVKFVSIISTISILGVTIGVAALVVVLSVFNGFGSLVSSILINFDPHLRMESTVPIDSSGYRPMLEYISHLPNVKACSPFVGGKALIVSRNVNRVVNIRGLETDKIPLVSGLSEKLVLGSANLDDHHRSGIILGLILADRLGAVIGDTLSIVSPSSAELATMQLALPIIRRFRVVGIYESNNKDYDGYYAFTNLAGAQSLFDRAGRIDGIDIRFQSIDHADEGRNQLMEKFGKEFRYLTWYDLHRELFTVMQIERWCAYIVLCLIIAVASFNLLGSLAMTVIEKRRDIGILKSMGATNKSLKKIFGLQGLFVGIVGTIAGSIIGLFIVYLQERYHLVALDTTIYIIPAMPVEVHFGDLVYIGVAAIGLCSLASRLPAKRAANLDPVKAIRWE